MTRNARSFSSRFRKTADDPPARYAHEKVVFPPIAVTELVFRLGPKAATIRFGGSLTVSGAGGTEGHKPAS